MHFWVSAARVSRPGTAPAHLLTSAFFWPRKTGTNWFMPAFVNSRFGESGMRLEDGTMVCRFDLKKSRKSFRTWLLGRIWADVIMANLTTKERRNKAGISFRQPYTSLLCYFVVHESFEN